jgi:hypothetical protein
MANRLRNLSILLLTSLLQSCHGLVIMESTAEMFLSYDEDDASESVSLPEVFVFEGMTSQLFLATLQQQQQEDGSGALGDGNEALSVVVAVRGTTLDDSNTRRTVNGIVTCTYLSTGYPASLDTALMYATNTSALSYRNVALSFRPYEKWQVLDKYEDNTMTAADKGLIAATVGLSVMLIAVSAVLLHVTGGWSMCHQRICNCLFEEIDDDNNRHNVYPIDHKDTFHADEASAYGDNNYDQDPEGGNMNNNIHNNPHGGMMMMDDQSVDTGMHTNASGVLGVQQNPAAGMGILQQTPDHSTVSRDYNASRYADDTPISTSDRPLGIASIRDQQSDANEPKGLAHMIMERLTHYSGSKE